MAPSGEGLNMNWVDIVIAILVLGLSLLGWRKGVVKLIFTLVGGVVGMVLAGQLWEQVAGALPINNESVANIAAFVTILAAVMVLSWIAARILMTVLNVLLLRWVDGAAGAAIGLVLGGMAATAVVSAAGIVPSDTLRDAVNASTLAEPLIQNMDIVYSLLPSEFDSVKNLVRQGKELLDQSAALLEASAKVQELLTQGTDLLEAASGLEDLISQAQSLTGPNADRLVVGFTGFAGFGGAPLLAVFEDPSGSVLGPVSTSVLTSGVAVLAVDGLTDSVAYAMTYYVDGNRSGTCNETADDVKGAISITADATEAGMTYDGNDGSGRDLCASFLKV